MGEFGVCCAAVNDKYKILYMASPSKRRGPAAPPQTSLSIAEQTAAFLKTGGKVEEVPRGISGQPGATARKHITISTKSQ